MINNDKTGKDNNDDDNEEKEGNDEEEENNDDTNDHHSWINHCHNFRRPSTLSLSFRILSILEISIFPAHTFYTLVQSPPLLHHDHFNDFN